MPTPSHPEPRQSLLSRDARPSLLLALLLVGCDGLDGGVEIVRYTGPAIAAAVATVPDPVLGTPRGWDGLTIGDEVLLGRRTLCGDECGEELVFEFEGRGALPSDIEATLTRREALPERIEEREVAIARVEVQDWGPEVYSGVAYPEPQDGASTAPIVFGADDLPAAPY